MALWKFGKESAEPIVSDGTGDVGLKRGGQPFPIAVDMASKRNVILTDAGWVRRTHGEGGRAGRQFDEIIVAANPDGAGSYTLSVETGFPDVAQIYVKLNANNVLSANVSANVYVVFNTPLTSKSSGNVVHLAMANTIGGDGANAVFSNNATARITNGNNTLVFEFIAPQGGVASAKATYSINAQSMVSVGGGNPLYNPDVGIPNAANLVISAATSNNVLDGEGSKIVTFQVSPNGV